MKDFIWSNRLWDKFICADYAEFDTAPEWVMICSMRHSGINNKWYGY